MEITINNYHIKKLAVTNDFTKDDTNLQIQMEQKINYKFQEDQNMPKGYFSLLSLTATEKSENPRIVLTVEIEVHFTLSEEIVDKKVLNDESLLAFLPYLSSYVGLLSALTGFPPMFVAKPDLNSPNRSA